MMARRRSAWHIRHTRGSEWDDLRRIKNHPWMIQPTFNEIMQYLREYGCKTMAANPNKIYDLYNGVIYRMMAQDIENTQLGIDDGCDITAFLNALDIWQLSGNVPLARMAEVVLLIEAAATKGDKGSGSGAQAAPLLGMPGEDPDEGDEEKAAEDAEIMNEMLKLNEHLEVGDNAFIAKNVGIELTESVGHRITKLDKETISFLRILSQIGEMSLSKHRGKKVSEHWTPSRAGEKVMMRRMRSYSEVNKIPLVQRFLPITEMRIIRKTAQVRQRMNKDKREAKQIFFLLIDDSGSMSSQDKIDYVRLILLQLLQKVVDGDAMMYVTTFECEMDGFTIIEDEVDAQHLLDNFFGFNRGITNIARVIEDVSTQFREGYVKTESNRKERLPQGIAHEIIIVNDGQDSIDPSFRPPVPTHAICLFQDNENLSKVCRASGGEYYSIDTGIER